LNVIGAAPFASRRFDQAVPKFLLAIQEDPNFPFPYHYLAACYAQMGRLDDAREVVARLGASAPVVVPSADSIRNPEQRELLLAGWRLARGEGP
jgi:Flp pilus assembly protein TadD